jgi:hypothetical protein
MSFYVYITVIKNREKPGAWQWLIPKTLCTCEDEIRRMVLGYHGQNKFVRPPFQQEKLGMVAHICHPSYGSIK